MWLTDGHKVPEVVDQNAPVTGFDLSASTIAETRSYWEGLLADPAFILTGTNAPSRDAALEELLSAARIAVEQAPGAPVVIAEGWSDITGDNPSADDMALWHMKTEVYHPQYLALVDAVRDALPEVTILSLPLGSVLSDILTLPALSELQAEAFFSAEAPQGTALLSSTAGLVVQTAQTPEPLPADAWTLPADIAFAAEEIAKTAQAAVGGALVVASEREIPDGSGTEPEPDNATPLTGFIGTDENDLIPFNTGLETVQGGGGTDTFMTNALSDSVTITTDASGAKQLVMAADATPITLQDVERIAFEDGTLAFDDTGLAGQAYRLYQACFDRAPDAEGLGFWIKQLDAGAVTLTQAAELFLQSDEFAEVYGAPAELVDVHYLALLYANVLDRVPDTDGFGYWLAKQAKGVTRADMLVSFSESAENVSLVAEAIDDGIWYI